MTGPNQNFKGRKKNFVSFVFRQGEHIGEESLKKYLSHHVLLSVLAMFQDNNIVDSFILA